MLPTKIKDNVPAKRGKGVLARTLARFRAESKQRAAPRARIGFVIDATASRAQTWAQAQKIQARMFEAVAGRGAIVLRLVHFGGGALTDHGWMGSPKEIAKAMRKVECMTGLTQYAPALNALLDGDERPDAVILIGDMFEEDKQDLSLLAHALSEAGIKVHSFLEGDDETAACAFSALSRATGGAFARFGDELPLHDLCAGVALLSTGGSKGLARLGNSKVERLLLSGPADEKE